MFLSFMNYFAIQCFPDTYNLVREGPNITPHVTDLMVRAKKILGHEGRCAQVLIENCLLEYWLTLVLFPSSVSSCNILITKHVTAFPT